jgi:8-oxo-dGTP pyrophosphatase MutT (NUDIX family)
MPLSQNHLVSLASTSAVIERLRDALHRPLPGLPAQMLMAPDSRPGTELSLDPSLDCRHAAVLALLYPCAGGDGLCLVLTRRTESVDSHRGQISFPGGSMDPGEIPVETALREANEELGVDPTGVEMLGELSRLYIQPSDFCVYPVVAYTAERPSFVANSEEVAEVIEVPVSHLLALTAHCEEIWQIRGAPTRVPFYVVGHHKVWGATAMMLSELLMLFTEAT